MAKPPHIRAPSQIQVLPEWSWITGSSKPKLQLLTGGQRHRQGSPKQICNNTIDDSKKTKSPKKQEEASAKSPKRLHFSREAPFPGGTLQHWLTANPTVDCTTFYCKEYLTSPTCHEHWYLILPGGEGVGLKEHFASSSSLEKRNRDSSFSFVESQCEVSFSWLIVCLLHLLRWAMADEVKALWGQYLSQLQRHPLRTKVSKPILLNWGLLISSRAVTQPLSGRKPVSGFKDRSIFPCSKHRKGGSPLSRSTSANCGGMKRTCNLIVVWESTSDVFAMGVTGLECSLRTSIRVSVLWEEEQLHALFLWLVGIKTDSFGCSRAQYITPTDDTNEWIVPPGLVPT